MGIHIYFTTFQGEVTNNYVAERKNLKPLYLKKNRIIAGYQHISMYDLPYHKEHDERVINEFIDRYPFALVTGCDSENKPIATQIPVLCRVKLEKMTDIYGN